MFGSRSAGVFSGASCIGGHAGTVEHSVADVSDERLELAGDCGLVDVVVHPDAGEERGEELALDRAGRCNEEGIGSGHQVEVAEHHLGALLERLGSGVQAGTDLVLLHLQISEPSAELVGGERSVGCEVDEAFFLDVELLEFLLQARTLLGVTGEDVVECCLHFPFRFVDGVGGEAEAGELPGQRALKFVRREVGQVAETVLASSAEEVLVDLIGVILGLGEDEAVLAPGVVAAAAVQHAAGEVVVDAVTLSPLHAGVDDLLDPVEELWGDECLVSPRVDVSFEGDHAEVVRVAEDLTELAA
ncbi:hypothetical protein SK224_01505 [Microbacterium sp. BG28]|nr:hypothetical protein [Microbacterium sp. BG28]MDY0827794.1 hypothetical protein [Microbacterium sp. BG28]